MRTPLTGRSSSFRLLRGATAARGDPVIAAAQKAHGSGNFGEPDQRPPPPDLFRELDDGICAAGMMATAVEKTNFTQEFLRHKSEQRANAWILQRRHAQIAAFQNGSQPSRDARAKLAIGVEEKPAARVAAFAIGVFVHSGDQRST